MQKQERKASDVVRGLITVVHVKFLIASWLEVFIIQTVTKIIGGVAWGLLRKLGRETCVLGWKLQGWSTQGKLQHAAQTCCSRLDLWLQIMLKCSVLDFFSMKNEWFEPFYTSMHTPLSSVPCSCYPFIPKTQHSVFTAKVW